MTTIVETHESAHPGPATYVAIAVILALITITEVAIVYTDAAGALLVSSLLALSAIKFALVGLFYMHLKFDSRLFSVLFVGGLALASAVLLALVALFRNFYLP